MSSSGLQHMATTTAALQSAVHPDTQRHSKALPAAHISTYVMMNDEEADRFWQGFQGLHLSLP